MPAPNRCQAGCSWRWKTEWRIADSPKGQLLGYLSEDVFPRKYQALRESTVLSLHFTVVIFLFAIVFCDKQNRPALYIAF